MKTEVVGTVVDIGGVAKMTRAKQLFNCRRSCYNKSSNECLFIFDLRDRAAGMSLNSVQR